MCLFSYYTTVKNAIKFHEILYIATKFSRKCIHITFRDLMSKIIIYFESRTSLLKARVLYCERLAFILYAIKYLFSITK